MFMDTQPYICTKQEERALEFVEKSLSLQEPCSIVGLVDMGQEVLYRELLTSLPKKFSKFQLIPLFATSTEDIQKFIDTLPQALKHPTIVLGYISTPEDASFLIDTLDRIRLIHSTSFITVILSDIKSLSRALMTHKKSLTRSLFVLSPLSTTDTNFLFDSFSKRFDFTATDLQQQRIRTLGTGYIGLLKTLFLLQKDHPTVVLDKDWLLSQDAVIHRLTRIASEFSLQQLSQLVDANKVIKEDDIFEKYGITENDEIRNPLLFAFLTQQLKSPVKQAELLFTSIESSSFNYFLQHPTQTIDRSVLAQFIWGDVWEEKYSDWAIDQIIHRIREKLEKANAPYEIVTKKGEGFYLRNRT